MEKQIILLASIVTIILGVLYLSDRFLTPEQQSPLPPPPQPNTTIQQTHPPVTTLPPEPTTTIPAPMRPTNLLTLTPISSSFWTANEIGTQVTLRYERPWGHLNRSEAEFFIDENYSILRGRVSADEHLATETRMQLRIFSDGEMIYESDYIERATTFPFEVDVAGRRFIHVRIDNRHYSMPDLLGGRNGRITVSELFLYPQE